MADRASSLYDAGSRSSVTNDASAGLISFTGTMSNKLSMLGNTPVRIHFSFSTSLDGMIVLKNHTLIPTAEAPGTNFNREPDLTLSEMFPNRVTPPIRESVFNRMTLGVVPFVFARNNALNGLGNISSDQAALLMSASGTPGGLNGMPATYLGGVSTNPIYLIRL